MGIGVIQSKSSKQLFNLHSFNTKLNKLSRGEIVWPILHPTVNSAGQGSFLFRTVDFRLKTLFKCGTLKQGSYRAVRSRHLT